MGMTNADYVLEKLCIIFNRRVTLLQGKIDINEFYKFSIHFMIDCCFNMHVSTTHNNLRKKALTNGDGEQELFLFNVLRNLHDNIDR